MSAAPESHGVRRVAHLSVAALDDALSLLLEHAGKDAYVDLRADAYGHGAHDIETRSRARGVTRFIREGENTSLAGDADGDPGVGQIVYGFDPNAQPIMSLEGEVIAVKQVPAGTAVSYGYQYRTSQAATLALVGLGYADGVPRLASSRAMVTINGARGVIAGRIAMDQLVVDLGSLSATVGEAATLWHDAASLEAWTTATERSAAALTTGLGARIYRRWNPA
jgi:alanine racemase